MPHTAFTLTPIGVIHSPHPTAVGAPIQPVCAAGARGQVHVFAPFAAGVQDLEGFARIWLLFLFDRSRGHDLRVVPFRDTVPRGLFATRAPRRPNSIGLSCVRLIAVGADAAGPVLEVADIDVLDGTPLLDIKPYVPEFDAFPGSRAGWLDDAARTADSPRTHADDRFERS